MAKKQYEDDDGRVIADMSDFERPSAFSFGRGRRTEKNSAAPEQQMSRAERRMYVFTALKAALLIGMTFIVGLALIILLAQLIWKIF